VTAFDLIKKWEGLRLEAYLCSAGVPTIGYGHTHGISLGMTCTEDQANQWLIEDILDAHKVIERLVTVSLNDHQLDALTSFVFNLGVTNLQHSTLLKLLNQGKYMEASNQIPRWNRAGGSIIQGLVNRREEERQLFNS